jgi:hypothetical protein
MRRHWRLISLLAVTIVVFSARPVRADLIFDVTLDTTALTVAPGASSGPFALYFQLIDGSGLGNADNIVTLSDFVFGGGGAAGLPLVEGGAAGDLGSDVTLADTSFFNSFLQGFVPGGVLSFAVRMTAAVDASGTPDAFAFSILDSSGFPLPSSDPTLADTLLTIMIDSADPAVLTYGTDPARGSVVMSAPAITPAITSVPEPASLSLVLVGTAVTGLNAYRSRRARKRARP